MDYIKKSFTNKNKDKDTGQKAIYGTTIGLSAGIGAGLLSYGGYKTYQWFKNKRGDVGPTSEDFNDKIKRLGLSSKYSDDDLFISINRKIQELQEYKDLLDKSYESERFNIDTKIDNLNSVKQHFEKMSDDQLKTAYTLYKNDPSIRTLFTGGGDKSINNIDTLVKSPVISVSNPIINDDNSIESPTMISNDISTLSQKEGSFDVSSFLDNLGKLGPDDRQAFLDSYGKPGPDGLPSADIDEIRM